MPEGKVKFFNYSKGFGFIVDNETNEDIFVHASGLNHDVQEGDNVSFQVTEGKKGPNAINVKSADE